MHPKSLCWILVAFVALQHRGTDAGHPESQRQVCAVCVLRPNGTATTGVQGRVTFLQKGPEGKVTFNGTIIRLTPGFHGFHIHEFGNLSNGCASTGAHFNPFKVLHAGPNDVVRHVGDLGNVFADSHGTATFLRTDNVINLYGRLSIIGRACVVHQNKDDLGRGGGDSQNTGNAGARLACGIIRRCWPR